MTPNQPVRNPYAKSKEFSSSSTASYTSVRIQSNHANSISSTKINQVVNSHFGNQYFSKNMNNQFQTSPNTHYNNNNSAGVGYTINDNERIKIKNNIHNDVTSHQNSTFLQQNLNYDQTRGNGNEHQNRNITMQRTPNYDLINGGVNDYQHNCIIQRTPNYDGRNNQLNEVQQDHNQWNNSSPHTVGQSNSQLIQLNQSHQKQTPNQKTNNENNIETCQNLQSEIEKLKSQLEAKSEALFDISATLATVEAESLHKINTTQSKANEQIKKIQEELRRSELERNKFNAMLAEEKKRRRELTLSFQQQLRPAQAQDHSGGVTPIMNENCSRQSFPAVTPTANHSIMVQDPHDNNKNRTTPNNSITKLNVDNISTPLQPTTTKMVAAMTSNEKKSNINKEELMKHNPSTPNVNVPSMASATLISQLQPHKLSQPQFCYPNDFQLAKHILAHLNFRIQILRPASTPCDFQKDEVYDIKSKKESINKVIPNKMKRKRSSNKNDEKLIQTTTQSPSPFEQSISTATVYDITTETQSVLSSMLQNMLTHDDQHPHPTNSQEKSIALIHIISQILVSHHGALVSERASHKSKKTCTTLGSRREICSEMLFLIQLLHTILLMSPYIKEEVIRSMIILERKNPDFIFEQKTRIRHNYPGKFKNRYKRSLNKSTQKNENEKETYFTSKRLVKLLQMMILMNVFDEKTDNIDDDRENKICLNMEKVLQSESMRLLLLLLHGTDDKSFHDVWCEKIILVGNAESDNGNSPELAKGNMISVFKNSVNTNNSNDYVTRVISLRLITFLLFDTQRGTDLQVGEKKKIVSICMQHLQNWVERTHYSPLNTVTSDLPQDYHCSLDFAFEITQFLQKLCCDWENGVTMLLSIPALNLSKKDSKLKPASPLSGVGILIETLDLITSQMYHSSFEEIDNDIFFKWKRMLSQLVGLFTTVVNHTQNLRQIHEEKKVPVKDWISFLSIIAERKDMFCACCELICHKNIGITLNASSSHQDEKMTRDAKTMLEEIACDEDEVEDARAS